MQWSFFATVTGRSEPESVVLGRVRGTAYLTVAISGTGMFAVFLFLTYYLATFWASRRSRPGSVSSDDRSSDRESGRVRLGTSTEDQAAPARTGWLFLAPIGMAMLSENFSYVVPALPALLIACLGFGFIFGPVQNAATSGVSAGESGGRRRWWTLPSRSVEGSVGRVQFTCSDDG